MAAVLSVYKSRELLWNLTLRELRTKYRNSFLGWAWSMLNPLANVAIYTFIFNVLFQSSAPPGDPSGIQGFAYFLLCAMLPWNFFSLVTTFGLAAIAGNAGLVRRVAFPREVLVFSTVLHAFVQFMIELGLLTIILLIAGSPILVWLPAVLLTSVVLTLFSAGFALALSALAVFFRDIRYLWTIFMQIWFFLTPIVYAPSKIRDQVPGWAQLILRANPMSSFVTAYRYLLYDAKAPTLGHIVIMVVSAVLSFTAGWLIFSRLGRRLPEEV